MSTAYLVFFKNVFFPEILFREKFAVNPAFQFLFSSTCIGDLLISGHTDLNLTDGRFWDSAGTYDELSRAIPSLREDDENLYKLRRCRSAKDLSELGVSAQDLGRIFHSPGARLGQKFIPFLGPLKIARNAIPHIKRARSFAFASSFLAPDFRQASRLNDQTSFHFPIAVDIRSQPKLLNLPQGIHADCKLRINLYPYGLCSIFLVVSLRHGEGLKSDHIMGLQNAILSTRPGGIAVKYSNCHRGTVSRFFDWTEEKISKAVLRYPRSKTQATIYRFVCMEGSVKIGARGEQLGILLNSPKWEALSEEYIASNPSFFGRYRSEFAHATSVSLVLSFAFNENTRKKKIRVRFIWNFLATFHFLISKKTVYNHLIQKVGPKILTGRVPAKQQGILLGRASGLVEKFEEYQSVLLPPHRKFFYQLQQVLKLGETTKEVYRLFERHGLMSELEAQRSELRALSDLIEVNTRSIKSALSDIMSVRQLEDWRATTPEAEVDHSAAAIHDYVRGSISCNNINLEGYQPRVVKLLGDEVWNSLVDDARGMLVSGEFLIDLLSEKADYSCAVIEYCKAVEAQLNRVLMPQLFSYAHQISGNSEIACGKRLLRAADKITLGAVPYLMAPLWKSRNSSRPYENKNYDNRLTKFYVDLLLINGSELDKFLMSLAGEIQDVAELRNEAAHSSVLKYMDAARARRWWQEARGAHLLFKALSRKM